MMKKQKKEDKEKAKELLDNFSAELIRRAKEYAVKDTNLDTISPFRIEYKEFKDEYEKPYMTKMKKLLEDTKEKYKKEEEELSKYTELNKHGNRKELSADQKKKLKVKLEEAEKSVKFFSELIEKIKEYSGIKNLKKSKFFSIFYYIHNVSRRNTTSHAMGYVLSGLISNR